MRYLVLVPGTLLAAAGLCAPAAGQEAADPLPAPTIAEAPPAGSAVHTVKDPAAVDAPVDPPRRYPLFPIGGKRAAERGYRLPPALGASGMYIHNVQNMESSNLAVAIAIGSDPPEDTTLTDLPFVTTTQLESHSSNSEFKADLWIFPFLNVFAGIGKVKGHIDIGVDIDLDAFVPPPFCRPADPCGHIDLPFRAEIDNTTTTVGAIAAYGGDDWFASVALAKTLSVSSKDRSDIETTNIGLRAGPRFHFGKTMMLFPYAGVNYFEFDAEVSGVVRSGPVLPDDQTINLRYQVDLSSRHPWSVINGVNLELSRHWGLQAEYNWGQGSDRVVLTATFRP